MSMTHRTVAAVLACGATGAAVVSAHAATIAQPQRATPVAAWHGMTLWSTLDPSSGSFGLTLRAADGRIRALPVAPSPMPFDADLGDDADANPVVAYATCLSGPSSCDIRVLRVSDGADESVAAAARPGVAERTPTISRGRLAWSVMTGASVKILTARLGSRSPATSLPALPRRRCITQVNGLRRCGKLTGVINDLELDGSTLAISASTTLLSSRYGEMRLDDIAHHRARQVLSFGAGEAGQQLIGPSVAGRYAYGYKTCTGDPSGCKTNAGVFRVRLSDGRVQLAADKRQLSGFAVDGSQMIMSAGDAANHCELDQGSYPGVPGVRTGPCPIDESALPSTWRPFKTRS